MIFAVFLRMVIAHILGDFYLQCDKWVDDKRESGWKSKELYCHSALIAILTYFFSGLWLTGLWLGFWMILTVFISHTLIDLLKVHLDNKFRKNLYTYILDQALHIAVLVIITYLIGVFYETKITTQMPEFLSNPVLLIIIIAYLLIITPTGFFIKEVLSPLRYKVNQIEQSEIEKQNGECNNLDNAGKLIGYLERILVLTFILINQYAAIGFLITAKSIFRFREDKNYLVEYYLLGTFLSITIVLLIGLVTVFASDILWPSGLEELYISFKLISSNIP